MSIPFNLSRWSRPGSVDFETSQEGLVTAQIRTPKVSARFAIQGAHLIEFSPFCGKPLLFVSQKTHFAPGKAIRGGIPVIFPWFGPREGHPKSPMHGLVRTRDWSLDHLEMREDGSARIEFGFRSTDETLALWPHPFELRLAFELGAELKIEWRTRNTGTSVFSFEQALHPYFPVHDIATASVEGLAGVEYIDKAAQLLVKRESSEPIRFVAETDRLYLDTDSECVLKDPSGHRELHIEKSGSKSSVVWNPWIAKAAALADLDNEEWRHFVCVEQANASRNALPLAPNETHLFQVRYALKSVD